MHKESVMKIHFNLNSTFVKKIKCIDKQKEESLRWHVSKIEKIRKMKWSSLEGPSPVPSEPIKLESCEEIPPDLEMSRATSFYAWDNENPTQTKSIITSIKPPVELNNSENISFTEVTKFYNNGDNNPNSLLRNYPRNEETETRKNKSKKTHIYIPHVNKQGRVVRHDAFQKMKDVEDYIPEEEFKQTNIEEFKEKMEKKIASFRRPPTIPSFPEPKKPYFSNLVRKLDKKRTQISNMRSRSNSRLSQALREIEKSDVVLPAYTEVEDEAFLMSLEEDTNIPSEETVAKISSILEREDRAQSATLFMKSSDIRLRKLFSSEEKREECQNVIMTDMEQHHYVRTIGRRGFEKHDVTCGCNKYHSSYSYSEVEM